MRRNRIASSCHLRWKRSNECLKTSSNGLICHLGTHPAKQFYHHVSLTRMDKCLAPPRSQIWRLLLGWKQRIYISCVDFTSKLAKDAFCQSLTLTLDRRRPTHPLVQQHVDLLYQCVKRLPASGALFTCQSPLFPIFLMGVISKPDGVRKVVSYWFETVMKTGGYRSVSNRNEIPFPPNNRTN